MLSYKVHTHSRSCHTRRELELVALLVVHRRHHNLLVESSLVLTLFKEV
jgi:hypothetical protein